MDALAGFLRPLGATRDRDGRWIGGSPAQWAEELTGAVVDHGAAGFMLFSPPGGTPDIESLTRWAQEIVPAVRDPLGASQPARSPPMTGSRASM
jgi:hypothetical protein